MPAFPNGDVQNGYEGPTTWFSNRGPSPYDSGTVNFSPALGPGRSTYFALESAPHGLPLTTYLTAKQTAAGVTRRVLYLPSGVPIRAIARLTGGSGHLAGRISFGLFSNRSCSTHPIPAGTRAATVGVVPSTSMRLVKHGRYYWQVRYSGDPINAAAVTACGSQTILIPRASKAGLPSSKRCVSELRARLRIGGRAARAAEVFANGKLVRTFLGNKIHIRLHRRETIAMIVSSIRNAFAKGATSPGAFRQQTRTYRPC